MAQQIFGTISSIGLMNGMLGINDIQGGRSYLVKASDKQREKMFPSLHIGDKIEVWINPDDTIKGGIKVLEKATVEPVQTPVTKYEEKVIKEVSREQTIVWQSCMKIAVEIEKFYATGGAEDRQETTKNVIVVTNALYEASMRKFNGLPPIPEIRG